MKFRAKNTLIEMTKNPLLVCKGQSNSVHFANNEKKITFTTIMGDSLFWASNGENNLCD